MYIYKLLSSLMNNFKNYPQLQDSVVLLDQQYRRNLGKLPNVLEAAEREAPD